MSFSRVFFIFVSAAAAALANSAQASLPESVGLTPSSVAWDDTAWSGQLNPAQLSHHLGRRNQKLWLSVGTFAYIPMLDKIRGIVLENEVTSTQTTTGDYSPNSRNTIGQRIGIGARIGAPERAWAVGLTAYLPYNPLAAFDTGQPYLPEYPLLNTRNAKPEFALMVSKRLTENWSVGVGLRYSFAITAFSEVFVQPDPALPSWMRISASVKPRVSPYFSLAWFSPDEKLTFGLTVRAPVRSPQEIKASAATGAIGNIFSLDLILLAHSTLFYDPWSVDVGTSVDWAMGRTHVSVGLELWQNYEPPTLSIASKEADCDGTDPDCVDGVSVSGSATRNEHFRNRVAPKLVHEARLGRQTLIASYRYLPGIIDPDHLSEGGNLLDPDRHGVLLALRTPFSHFLELDVPWLLEAFVQYEALSSIQVTKTAGNEAGNGADQKVGAPGYKASGKNWGGGVTLQFAW